MSLHYRNELVQRHRVTVVEHQGKPWNLFTTQATLKNGQRQKIYFFSTQMRNSAQRCQPCEMPAGFTVEVVSNQPVLRKR